MKRQKALFRDSGRSPGTVSLNTLGTPEREFGLYAEAFHEGGRALVQGLKSDRRFGLSGLPLDSFKAVPVVYLYRHAMELSLKSIILAGSDILSLRGKARKELRTDHQLLELTDDVAQIFEAFGWDWNFGLTRFKTLEDFRSIIGELNSDGNMRYPTRKDGAAVLQTDFRFNLFEFCELLDPVYEVLSLRELRALAQLQSEYQMRAEWSQYDAGSGFSPDGY
jgi:hypothetical protein